MTVAAQFIVLAVGTNILNVDAANNFIRQVLDSCSLDSLYKFDTLTVCQSTRGIYLVYILCRGTAKFRTVAIDLKFFVFVGLDNKLHKMDGPYIFFLHIICLHTTFNMTGTSNA